MSLGLHCLSWYVVGYSEPFGGGKIVAIAPNRLEVSNNNLNPMGGHSEILLNASRLPKIIGEGGICLLLGILFT